MLDGAGDESGRTPLFCGHVAQPTPDDVAPATYGHKSKGARTAKNLQCEPLVGLNALYSGLTAAETFAADEPFALIAVTVNV
jgi:hypothetical protein